MYSRIGMGYAFTVRDFADRSDPSAAAERIVGKRTALFRVAIWRDSPSVCSLTDDERHLGHIVNAGDCWLAFDTTHFNEAGTGFRLLGSWTNIAQAKCAVELATANERDSISRLQ
jgi:hypothetical protein